MIQGLYAAASGMAAVEGRHAALANNIANAATPGFKRQEPVQLGFYQMFSGKMRQPSRFGLEPAPAGGVRIVETYTNLAGGPLRNTDNPLNVALQGPGYIVLDTPRGERFTRSGDFGIDTDGHLANSEGFKVQSVSGQPIDVRGGTVNIAQTGQVTVDGVSAGQIRVIEFEEPTRLSREGMNLLSASKEVMEKSTAAANTKVAQNQLEMSNVNLSSEMIKLMMGLRAYEANQRVINAMDDTTSRLIERVGMPT